VNGHRVRSVLVHRGFVVVRCICEESVVISPSISFRVI
jgi:hypothetical protein